MQHVVTELLEDVVMRDALITSQFPAAIGFLCQLFNREYFIRTWCLQEVVASTCCIAKCSELEMDFFELVSTITYVLPYESRLLPDTTLGFWQFMSTKRLQFGPKLPWANVEGSLAPLVNLLALTREFKATDPRDKIFALLGISDEGLEPILGSMHPTLLGKSSYLRRVRRVATGIANYANALAPEIDLWRHPVLKPDYSKELVGLYRDITRFLIRKNPGVLDVLGHVQHTHDPAESFFPSWVPRWFQPRSSTLLGGTEMFFAGLGGGQFALVHDNPLLRNPLKPDSLQLDGFKVDIVQKVSEVMSFSSQDTIPVKAIWNQMFDVPLFPRSNKMYQNGDFLDVAFCMTLVASPFGLAVIESMDNPRNMPTKDPSEDTLTYLSRVLSKFERQAKADIDLYLLSTSNCLSNSSSGQSAPSTTLQPPPTTDGNASRFIKASKICSYNRRFFLTQSGYMGIGPMMMRPGDEVCVLFGGRPPYILRPMVQGYHVFVGEAYLHNREIMWGNTTAIVRLGKGQSQLAVVTFELR